MAIIKAFKAIRPLKDLASKIAALPYDVMNSEEAREMVKDNEYSFLHVDRAEVNLSQEVNIYDKIVYEKAKEVLKRHQSTETLRILLKFTQQVSALKSKQSGPVSIVSHYSESKSQITY